VLDEWDEVEGVRGARRPHRASRLPLQGYLAHKEQPPPPRTTIGPWAYSYCRVLGERFVGYGLAPAVHTGHAAFRCQRVQRSGYRAYRGTSLIRPPPPAGPYSSRMPRDLW